jgi:pimeloyl-ACP methyl ester carboxylesterase/glycosidase
MERIPFLGATLSRLDLDALAERTGPLQPATARRIVARLNAEKPATERQPLPGELLALSLLHEAAHLAIVEASRQRPETALSTAVPVVREAVGTREVDDLLRDFAAAFPGVEEPPDERLEDLLLVHLANLNPAADPLRDLVDDSGLSAGDVNRAIDAIERHLGSVTLDPDAPASAAGLSLLELLREPARRSPDSLTGQLRYVREHWGWLLGDALAEITDRLDMAIGVLAEEEHGLHVRFGAGAGGGGAGGGGGEAPSFVGAEVESERFSTDLDWMPKLVLLAKSTYVWLDQLSKQHGRDIRTLDAIPDEELAAIAARGITGLWLIGLWQRSKASEKIKRWRGNADAVASAYSLDDYRIADDLGGEDALADLRTRAWAHGIRMASDMVPNHMGIDSRWVIEHPERFIAVDEPPFPSYQFEGRNLADDPRIEIRIEDHYWDDSDAAVVFERRDTAAGERTYLYHGNDGTSFPWNDTAQLDFAKAEVREVVIQTILDVARRFPVIRFDAAMVLAKKHVERLWYPEPGAGGAIPSRAEHAIPKAVFDQLMPDEFWREVVDRVAAEAPDTLLLAEAFWLLEGYFVRTLGMHRVYNSAFMHMIRDEDNAGYRKVIRDTIEFDPAILGRYVNFLTNPDEETAIEQFGTGDKYFGAATLLATLPGLPMVGHGQIEGFTEKYGMEFQRARLAETPNQGLIAHYDAQIVPLLRERQRFAGSADFRLYDVTVDGESGRLVEDVFAYSNGRGPDRSLIVFHNRFGSTSGWIRDAVPFAVKHDDGTKTMAGDVLADALELHGPADGWLRFRDRRSGRESLRSAGEIRASGLFVALGAYECLVLDDLREVTSTADAPWAELAAQLGGRGVPSLDAALADLLTKDTAAAVEPTRATVPAISAVPAVERTLTLGDGRRVAVAEWGDPTGRPVFLLHGMPGSRLLCPDVALTEAAGVRLIAFDRPGYGGSDRKAGRRIVDGGQDILDVATALGLDRFAVAGWSSGGPYALACAAVAPERVTAVAVVAGDAPFEEFPELLDEESPAGRERIAAIRRGDATALASLREKLGWFAEDPDRMLGGPPTADAGSNAGPDARLRMTPAVDDALRTMMREAFRQGIAGFEDDWLATYTAWGFRLGGVLTSVDIWWGDADQLSSGAHAEALAAGIRGAALHVVPGAGHLVAATHWAAILAALRAPVPPAAPSSGDRS